MNKWDRDEHAEEMMDNSVKNMESLKVIRITTARFTDLISPILLFSKDIQTNMKMKSFLYQILT